jgi:hypothetical protein
MLDKFYIAHNENNMLSLYDRVTITKRIIYCLVKILERLFAKNNGSIDTIDQKKAEEIISRLGGLFYE